MYTPKLFNTGWIVLACNLFLWINITVASPDEFHLKTPVTFLPVPIDFNQVVYVDTTTTAKVTFDSSFDKESPDRQTYSSVVEVNPQNYKVSWKIKCDLVHRTAEVTTSYTIENQPQEDVYDYTIISRDPKNVCLQYTSNNSVHVITMNADIGSFVMSMNLVYDVPTLINGTLIWYGICRN
jgi:hypothetical protein